MRTEERRIEKVWVTKSALTEGVTQAEVFAPRNDDPDEGYRYTATDSWIKRIQYGPKDWHRDRAAAVKRAEEMRTAKIKSLEKQIARVRAIKFGE